MLCESKHSMHSKMHIEMNGVEHRRDRCFGSISHVSQLSALTKIDLWPLIVAFLSLLIIIPSVNLEGFEIDANEVRNLALRFGKDITEGSAESTCLRKITENFKELGAKAAWFDANKMMEDMRNDVMNMLNWKKHAVERIANESERLAANHTFDKNLEIDYYNMKKVYDDRDTEPPPKPDWRPMKLSPHPNFENAFVNLDHSAVHVPINVFEKAPDIVNDIKWSDALTPFFKNNLAFDPGLSWQFFGSSKGFLRLYPATKWKIPVDIMGSEPPDLYDCRIRPWYIQGAASPKDIVILLDSSGSMTGLRREIAKNVVYNILDTLTDDDYVAALKFTNEVDFINKCFDKLVQANEKNVRELKESVDKVKTLEVANFTAALIRAFDLLQKARNSAAQDMNQFPSDTTGPKFNRTNLGSQCNQAIMLVTDGAPNTYEETFRQYNWPNIPVRVFTYLIGREVTANNEVYWMACHNRGYYTHVANLAEVREQVQQYIPVMSRPIVLSGERVFAWTPVYAHVSDVQLTDWVWEEREKALKTKYLQQRQTISSDSQTINNEEDEKDEEHDNDSSGAASASSVEDENHRLMNTEPDYTKKFQKSKKNLQLMTTLATPVFDTRNYTNITKRVLVKNVYQDSEPELIRIANLLGVAGIDVPIREIVKLTPAFKLGVNGYSYVITNNGYLLYHPDLRPMFQDMLKPFYSSVDMSEVELADNDLGPRVADPEIDAIRGNMINRTHGWKKVNVKIHMDVMKRVVTRSNNYIYGKIDFTPFSLAIVLPEPYGSYRVEGQVEVKVKHKEENFTHYFRGKQWRVHPEWVYCDNPHKMSGIVPLTPEEAITQFLNIVLIGQNFRWRTSSTRPQVYENISCDKDLIQSLVFDAKATDIEASKCGNPSSDSSNIEDKKIKMFGIVTTFVATRSGLTRFEDHRSEADKLNSTGPTGDRPFFDTHTRATEELYYRRAVDFHNINSSAFVFSVPFDASQRGGQILVTGSHAIFIGAGKSRAPAAVVGLQFKHSVFAERFFNFTNKHSKVAFCSSDEIDCFLLDNNAFVIVSEIPDHTGKFFGEIDNLLLQAMVTAKVYRKVHMYDYQAICLDIMPTSGPASMLFTPINHLQNIIVWVWTRIFMFYVHLLYNMWSIDASEYVMYDYDTEYEENENKNNRSRPRPCDKEYDLYEMVEAISEEPIKGDHKECHHSGCSRYFIVQYVPYTNLVMLAVHKSCPCETTIIKLEPKEVVYNESDRCHLLKTEMYRKRPTTCHNYHPQERDIKQCGRGSKLIPSVILMFLGFVKVFLGNT